MQIARTFECTLQNNTDRINDVNINFESNYTYAARNFNLFNNISHII